MGDPDGSAVRRAGEGAVRRAEVSRSAASACDRGGGAAPRAGGARRPWRWPWSGAAAAAPAAAPPAAPAAAARRSCRWWRPGGRRRSWRGEVQSAVGGAAAAGARPPPAQFPYDVTGWTLPMQMGVEVIAVSQPVGADTRATLRKLDRIEPIAGKVEGSGPGVRLLAQHQRRAARGERYSGRRRNRHFREDRQHHLRHGQGCERSCRRTASTPRRSRKRPMPGR